MGEHDIKNILSRTEQLISDIVQDTAKVRKIRERLLQVKLNNKIKNITTTVIDYSCLEEVLHAHP